jgi:hypothetical protein
MRRSKFGKSENITQSWELLIDIAPCVVDHGLHIWPNRARDIAKVWVRRAEIRVVSPIAVTESQNDEDEDEDEFPPDGYNSTVIQEKQIKWLGDTVALGRDQETQR